MLELALQAVQLLRTTTLLEHLLARTSGPYDEHILLVRLKKLPPSHDFLDSSLDFVRRGD